MFYIYSNNLSFFYSIYIVALWIIEYAPMVHQLSVIVRSMENLREPGKCSYVSDVAICTRGQACLTILTWQFGSS